jgi:hypothetical protein
MNSRTEKFIGAAISNIRARQILIGLSLIQVAFLLPAWKSGMVADNDFVAHLAWLKEWIRLVDQWGVGFHWSQKFNFGQPLLLFNLPPFSTVAAWLLTLVGLSPVAALKLLLSISLILTPWTMYWWHRMMMPKTRIVGLIAAAFSVLLANEFWGLGFHFCNGMVNAAIALPMVIAYLALIEKLMAKPEHPGRWLGMAGIVFGLICLTHLHSAFLAALFTLTIEIGRYIRHRNHGRMIRDMLSCVTSVMIGIGLAAFWLLPSLAHDAGIDWLHIWSPPTAETLRAFINGQLISGLRSTGLNTLSVDSAVSAYLILALALVGVVAKLRRRRDYGLIAACGLAMWLTLSPGIAGPLGFLPFFDRILHLRVASFLTIFLISLAARGAYACRKFRVGPLIFATLMVGVGLSALTMSMSIKTESEFAEKRRDLIQVADWLNENAASARIFSEFAGHSKEEVSANYLRHMLPVLADVQDGASFVYENSFNSKDFLRRGIYWGSIIPLIDLGPEYQIQYLIAWTATAKRVLSDDLRWAKKFAAGDYAVFELIPTLSPSSSATRQHLRLKQIGANLFETDLVVPADQLKIATSLPFSPGWTVVGHESNIRLSADESGLLNFELNNLAKFPATIQLLWTADLVRARIGIFLSGISLLIVTFLVAQLRTGLFDLDRQVMLPAESLLAKIRGRHVKIFGALLVAACILVRWDSFWNRDTSRPFEGFGKPLEADYSQLIGTWRDFAPGYAFQLVGSRWQGRQDQLTTTGRTLLQRSSSRQILPDMRVWIGEIDEVNLRLEFDTVPLQPVTIAIGGPEQWKYFEILSAQDLKLPSAALQAFLRSDSSRPGRFFDIAVLNTTEVRFRNLSIRNGLHYLQAEYFKQQTGDWTNQGSIAQWANIDLQQGLSMLSQMNWPMTSHYLGFNIPDDSDAGCYEFWYLGIPAHGGQRVLIVSEQEVLEAKEVASRKYGWIKLGTMRVRPAEPTQLKIAVPGLGIFGSDKRTVVTDALAMVRAGEANCGVQKLN